MLLVAWNVQNYIGLQISSWAEGSCLGQVMCLLEGSLYLMTD